MIPRFASCLPPVVLVALALYVAVLARRRRSSGPHPDGCPCGPCRSFEDAVREACAVAAEMVPGLPRDGKRLTGRERRVLRGIEAAVRNEREGAGL